MNLMKSTYICNLWYKRLMLGYLGTQITLQQTKLHAGNQHFPMWKRHLNVIDVHGFSPNWQAGALGYELPIFLYYIYINCVVWYGSFQVCVDCHQLNLDDKQYSQAILWAVKPSARSHRHWRSRKSEEGP